MDLNIVSSEIIAPSSPTPPHLRTHKLSLLDQLAPDCFVPIIFFYSSAFNDAVKSSDHLKKSLSRTVTRYYPLAGRMKDQFSVDCDDYGAAFIEARVPGEMCEFLKRPNNDFLEKLMPFKPNGNPNFPVSLIIQVTYFGCGGMAICVGFSHRIADIKTTANFVKSWAAVACGSSVFSDIADGISDFISIFPPQNLSTLFPSSSLHGRYYLSKEKITKRFVFDGDKIGALRDKMGNESSSGYRPTRFEVVSALILGGVMTAAREKDELNYTHLVAETPVNLRNRMIPPLPEQSFGNIVQLTTTNWPIEKTIDYNMLTEKLHESISIMNDDNVRKIHPDGYLNYMKNAMELSVNNCNVKQFTISSWCRNSFYNADFGWGKPIWVSGCLKATDVAILLDSRDDQGIEAWVGLSKNEMDKFENDPGIIAYASVDTSVV